MYESQPPTKHYKPKGLHDDIEAHLVKIRVQRRNPPIPHDQLCPGSIQKTHFSEAMKHAGSKTESNLIAQ